MDRRSWLDVIFYMPPSLIASMRRISLLLVLLFVPAVSAIPDLTGSGDVGMQDLLFVLDRFGSHDGVADINGDGVVDLLDLVIVARHFGRSVEIPDSSPEVPVLLNPNFLNDPTGFSTVYNITWSTLDGFVSADRSGQIGIAATSTPLGTNTALQLFYPQGMADGQDPGVVELTLLEQEVYVASFVRYDEDFIFHTNEIKTQLFLSCGIVVIGPHRENSDENQPGISVWTQRQPFFTGETHPGRKTLPHNVQTAPNYTPGEWMKVEAYFNANTNTARLWIDDVLVTDRNDVVFEPGCTFENFQNVGTWGGGGSNVPQSQSISIANTYISSPSPPEGTEPPPEDPEQSEMFPNEPENYVLVIDSTFNDAPLGTWEEGTVDGWGQKFLDSTRSAAIEHVQGAFGTSQALTYIYPPNHQSGGGVEAYVNTPGMQSCYVGAYVRLSENFYGHPSTITKVFYIQGTSQIGAWNAMWFQSNAAGTNALTPEIINQLEGGIGGRYGGTSGAIQRGEWHLLEGLLELPEGRTRYWVDGTLEVDQTVGGPEGVQGITLSGILGGVGDTQNPEEQRMQFDRVRVSCEPSQ